LEEFCQECQISVPSEVTPKAVWVELSDKFTGIEKRLSHPWLVFPQGVYDAVGSAYSRTTTPDRKRLSSDPPFRVGTPTHRNCAKVACPIDLDAWVDFRVCTPNVGSKFLSELKKKQTIDSKYIERLRRETIFDSMAGRDKNPKTCEKEDGDIVAQLWTALRLSRGHTWSK
jgi:hypothetical protein